MKRISIMLIVFFLLLFLTSCESEDYYSQVTYETPSYMSLLSYEDSVPYTLYGHEQPNDLYVKDVLTYKDDDIDFKLLHIYQTDYDSPNQRSSYGVYIKSNIDFSFKIYYSNRILYSIDFTPNGSFEFSQTIPNNVFVGIDDYENISLVIEPIDSAIYGDDFFKGEFTYVDNYEPTNLELESYDNYHNMYYSIVYTGIIILGFIGASIGIIALYNRYYKKAINDLLKEKDKKRFLLSPLSVTVAVVFISITGGLLVNDVVKTRYYNNRFDNLYVSETVPIWDLDFENMYISKVNIGLENNRMVDINLSNKIDLVNYIDIASISENVTHLLESIEDREPFCAEEGLICAPTGFRREIDIYITNWSIAYKLSVYKVSDSMFTCQLSNEIGYGSLSFTITIDDPSFSDITHIYNSVEDAFSIYVSNSD